MKNITIAPNSRLTQWGVRYLLFQLLVLPYFFDWLFLILNLPLDDLKRNLLYYTINFAALVGIFWKFLQASIQHALQNIGTVLIPTAICFLAYRLSSTLLDLGIYTLFPDFYNVNDSNINTAVQGQLPMWAFGAIVLVPPAEELIFRGALFGGLYSKNKILAWVVSVVGFCLLHIISYVNYYSWDVLLISAIQYLPGSICLAAAYRYSGNILSPIMIHAAINLIATLSIAHL